LSSGELQIPSPAEDFRRRAVEALLGMISGSGGNTLMATAAGSICNSALNLDFFLSFRSEVGKAAAEAGWSLSLMLIEAGCGSGGGGGGGDSDIGSVLVKGWGWAVSTFPLFFRGKQLVFVSSASSKELSGDLVICLFVIDDSGAVVVVVVDVVVTEQDTLTATGLLLIDLVLVGLGLGVAFFCWLLALARFEDGLVSDPPIRMNDGLSRGDKPFGMTLGWVTLETAETPVVSFFPASSSPLPPPSLVQIVQGSFVLSGDLEEARSELDRSLLRDFFWRTVLLGSEGSADAVARVPGFKIDFFGTLAKEEIVWVSWSLVQFPGMLPRLDGGPGGLKVDGEGSWGMVWAWAAATLGSILSAVAAAVFGASPKVDFFRIPFSPPAFSMFFGGDLLPLRIPVVPIE
jgi:hypothetical protein